MTTGHYLSILTTIYLYIIMNLMRAVSLSVRCEGLSIGLPNNFPHDRVWTYP